MAIIQKPNTPTLHGIGRRKSAVADVTVESGNGSFVINGNSGFSYMQQHVSRIAVIKAPLEILDQLHEKNTHNFIVKVQGGGLAAQAQAIKLGLAIALCKLYPDYRQSFKQKGYLTTDARCKERKKYGLKKARKAPQFSKR